MRAIIFNILIAVSFLSFKLVAQNVDYQAAAKSIDEDLKKEMKALSELRQEIAKERPALAEETEKIAAELRDKRRRSQLASQERDALLYELSSLSSDFTFLSN